MGQDFHVVRCVTCEIFQVQQVKKVNRWSCKVCGEKQSLLKEYGRGSGPDCRRHVQNLNAMRGAIMEEQEHDMWSLCEQEEAGGEEKLGDKQDNQVKQPQISRWIKYLDAPREAELEKEQDEEILMDRQQVHSNKMTDRKRRRTESPEQCCSVTREPVQPSTTTTNLSRSSPLCENGISPPDMKTDPVSRCVPVRCSNRQVQKREPHVNSWSLQIGRGTFFSCDDITTSTKPLLPASLFETDEEFSFDEEPFLSS